MQRLITFILIVLMASFTSCYSSKQVNSSKGSKVTLTDKKTRELGKEKYKKGEPSESNMISLLRRTPGLQISGSDQQAVAKVIGMPFTMNSDPSPLFVVDGMRVGTKVRDVADIVNPKDVARITVLKDPSDLSMYGVQGASGVVVIKTKVKN